ncbi:MULTISPECIES: pepsin/retropepsin-like aspartic protease family protein [Aequorivita]|uniref:Retropepsin-like domain-containing protein n=1 Tax=Aequorivita iocasae TaxID=2803865 RepID=A0ABX7DTM3_9FLAO|nr:MULTISPECIES: pepsin/retropepsin-like aspartic protease family protein [Aequorivita]QQX77157.1 retropepsin-like domain-containing protein [Aequorivita iocasae]UCA56644.1 retropepsin-like domain-containing protein [Aequorivita sp. F7]
MKKIYLLPILLFFIGCGQGSEKAVVDKNFEALNAFVVDLDYFTLREEFKNNKEQLNTRDSLYFEAILANAFNNPEKSNEAIDTFFKTPKAEITDSLAEKMLATKLTNHIYRAEYKAAVEINEKLQQQYAHLLDSTKLKDLQNTHKIWKALENTKPQKVKIAADVALPIVKDKVGLSTLATNIGGSTTNFVFDTGANFSVIQRSVAENLGLKIIPAQFDVDAATGLKVKSDLAVAEKLQLGEITATNVIFLVFDDKDLSFPTIDYEIKGIIGFPVIRALQEIQLTKDTLYVPQRPNKYSLKNLAYDEYMPIIQVTHKNDKLRFNFDTGAQTTSLYSKFYKKYHTEIDKNYTKTSLSTGGAGGQVALEGYVLKNVPLAVGKAAATIETIRLFPEKIGVTDSLHGNLGQDFIGQFEVMIISFKSASILFR